jgi:RNA polymerase sigma-70 factor (ECF subfamily)
VAQLLDDQPRAAWDHGLIALGLAHLDRSARGDLLTIWHLRAEIASLHAVAPSADETDWPRIAAVYEQLVVLDPSPMVELARAVAIARTEGPAAGLAALPIMSGNPYGEAARGLFLAGLGRRVEARRHLEKAQSLARTDPERRLMAQRLASLD